MAYGTKYRAAWVDIHDDAWQVDLKLDAYGGGVTSLDVASPPLHIESVDNTKDLAYGIHRTSAQLYLSDESAVFDEIRDSAPEDWQMAITGPADLLLWVSTKRIAETVQYAGPQMIEATDGIDRLKSIPWYADLDTAAVEGRSEFILVLADLLSRVNLDIPIRTVTNWYPYDSGLTTSDDILAELQLDVGWLYESLRKAKGGSDTRPKDVMCYDVLWHLLRRMHVKLMQSEGLWVMRQRSELDAAAVYTWTYDSAGAQTAEGNRVYSESIDGTDLKMAGRSYTKASGPAYERVEVTFKHGTVTGSLIRDPDFSTVNQSTAYWSPGGGISDFEHVVNSGVRLNDIANNPGTDTDEATIDALAVGYLQSSTPLTAVAFDASNSIEFNINIAYGASGVIASITPFYAFYAILATSGGSTYYLQDDGSWALSANKIGISLDNYTRPQTLSVSIIRVWLRYNSKVRLHSL